MWYDVATNDPQEAAVPRGRTRSQLVLSERRTKAQEMYTQGASVRAVAHELNVGEATARRYYKEWKDKLAAEAHDNPDMLTQVLENTVQALAETDLVRHSAWQDYHNSGTGRTMECPECENEIHLPPVPTTVRQGALNTVLKAQEQKSKLFGLFGVKQEFYLQVQKIKALQDKLLEFMRRQLCTECREKMRRHLAGADEEPLVHLPALQEGSEVIDV